MESTAEFYRLWARMIYRDDLGYRTVSFEIDQVPLLIVYHEKTLRFRVFIQGEFDRFDITSIIGPDTHDKCFQFISQMKEVCEC